MRFILPLFAIILCVSCASNPVLSDSDLQQMKTEQWSTDQIEKKFGAPGIRQSGIPVCKNKRGSQWFYSSGNMLTAKSRSIVLHFDEAGKLCDFVTSQNY